MGFALSGAHARFDRMVSEPVALTRAPEWGAQSQPWYTRRGSPQSLTTQPLCLTGALAVGQRRPQREPTGQAPRWCCWATRS
jgi:hypothetical protein